MHLQMAGEFVPNVKHVGDFFVDVAGLEVEAGVRVNDGVEELRSVDFESWKKKVFMSRYRRLQVRL